MQQPRSNRDPAPMPVRVLDERRYERRDTEQRLAIPRDKLVLFPTYGDRNSEILTAITKKGSAAILPADLSKQNTGQSLNISAALWCSDTHQAII